MSDGVGGVEACLYSKVPRNARSSAQGGTNQKGVESENSADLPRQEKTWGATLSDYEYFAGIRMNQLGVAWKMNQYANWGLKADYVNYGEIEAMDEDGNPTGTEKGSDLGVTFGYGLDALQFIPSLKDTLYFGTAIKYMQSKMAGYAYHAVALDAGLAWNIMGKTFGQNNENKYGWEAGLNFQNLGGVVSGGPNPKPVTPMNIKLNTSGGVELQDQNNIIHKFTGIGEINCGLYNIAIAHNISQAGKTTNVRGGLEYSFVVGKYVLSFRTGVMHQFDGRPFEFPGSFTFGGGIEIPVPWLAESSISLDYAYVPHPALGDSNLFSLEWKY